MHQHTNVLIGAFLLFALIFKPETLIAANVYITKGEGGAGLDAYFELDNLNQFGLTLRSCKRRRDKLTFSVDLNFRKQNKSSPQLVELWNSEDAAKRDLYVCINEICEEYQWQFAESAFYNDYTSYVWYTDNISIDQKRQKIRSVRVIIPNDDRKYEYQGDVDGVLKRICK